MEEKFTSNFGSRRRYCRLVFDVKLVLRDLEINHHRSREPKSTPNCVSTLPLSFALRQRHVGPVERASTEQHIAN